MCVRVRVCAPNDAMYTTDVGQASNCERVRIGKLCKRAREKFHACGGRQPLFASHRAKSGPGIDADRLFGVRAPQPTNDDDDDDLIPVVGGGERGASPVA